MITASGLAPLSTGASFTIVMASVCASVSLPPFATPPLSTTLKLKLALLGILPGEIALDWNQVIFKGLTLKGIYGREMFETWYKVTAMIQSGLDVSPVITHRFPIAQFETGFEVMRSGKSGKVVLEW